MAFKDGDKVEQILSNGETFTYIVDPNAKGKEGVNHEDLVMYVELTAYSQNRSIINSNSSFLNESNEYISFITSTKINNGNYVTTNFSKIGVNQKVEESFGIKKIDIEYNASFVPTVKMVFEDARGASIFNDYEEIDTNGQLTNSSKFNIFFKLPYPVFKLTVKGYYGSAVSYCLNMTKWNTQFNPDSGSFEIVADFVGYTFTFLADILMKNIISVANTTEGLNKLQGMNTIPLTNLFNSFGQLTRITETFKKTNDRYQELLKINSAISQLKTIQNKIGLPVNELTDIISNNLVIENITTPDNLIFFRDIGVLNVNLANLHNQFFNEANELAISYNSFIEDNKNIIKNNFKIDAFYVKTPLNSYTLNDRGVNAIRRTIEAVDKDFDTNLITSTFIQESMNISTVNDFSFIILNYFNIRKTISELITKIENYKKDVELEVNSSLNTEIEKSLKFNPTVENVIEIVTKNIDAYLEVIYDYAREAESKSAARLTQLNSVQTDLTDNNVYAFPLVADSDGNKVWLGSVVGEDNENFPEIRLVNKILNNYIFIQNQTEIESFQNQFFKNVVNDNLDWIPINLFDNDNNELFNINNLPTDGSLIPQELLDVITRRFYILSQISRIPVNDNNSFNIKQLTLLAELEGAYLADILINPQLRDYYNNLDLNDISTDVIDNILINEQLTINNENLNNYSFLIKGYGFKNAILDNLLEARNSNLSNSILKTLKSKTSSFEDIVISNKKENHAFISDANFFINKDFTDIGWEPRVLSNIRQAYRIETGDKYDTQGQKLGAVISYIKDLKFIDGVKNNNFDNGLNNVYENNAHLRIGRNYLTLEYPNSNTIFEIPEYQNSNNYGKFLLFLKSFNFDTNFNVFINELSKHSQICSVNVPYFLWVCGNIYRSSLLSDQQIDIIDTDLGLVSSFNSPLLAEDNFFTNIININQYDETFVNTCIQTYQSFVDNYYITGEDLNLENVFKLYVNKGLLSVDRFSSEYTVYKELYSVVLDFTTSVYTLGIINPLNIIPNEIEINSNVTNIYFTNFFRSFKRNLSVSTQEQLNVKTDIGNSLTDDEDSKIEIYYRLKNLYDKWIAFGAKNGKIYSNCAYNPTKSLFDYFHFVDRAWNYIGDKAVINPQPLMTLSSNTNISFYSFLSRVFQHSKFNFHVLPTYVNYYNLEDVQQMFEPSLEVVDVSQGATYLCMYIGGSSNVLDLNDGVYVNDGFDLREDFANKLPKDFKIKNVPTRFSDLLEERGKYNLAAFRVAYADQNQKIFKSINVGQQNIRETSESLMVQSDLFDSRGGSIKRFYKGIDLYPMYTLRSYECNVEALGNMQIQPLQYFQLDNIPFFHGAYNIMKVNHSITPNHITTKFKGYRLSKYAFPIIEDITSYVKLPLNESQVINLNTTAQQFSGNLSNGFDNTGLNDELLEAVEDSTRTLISFNVNNLQYEYKLIDEITENNIIDRLNAVFTSNTQNISNYGLGANLCYSWVKNALASVGIVQTPQGGVHAWTFFSYLSDRNMYYLDGSKDSGFTNDDLTSAGVKNGSFVFGFYPKSLYKDDAIAEINNAPNNTEKINNLTKFKKSFLSSSFKYNPITHVGVFYNGQFYDLIKGRIAGQPSPSFNPVAYYHFLDDLIALSAK